MATRYRHAVAFFVLLLATSIFSRVASSQQPIVPPPADAGTPAESAGPGTNAVAPESAPPTADVPPQTSGHTPPSTLGHASPTAPPPVRATPPPYSAPAYLPAPSPPPALPPAAERDAVRYGDAHSDRIILAPTAETHPKGSIYLSSYEIVLLQAGYAISDTTQLTVTSMPPLGQDPIFPLDVSVKTVVLRDRYVRAAAIGSATGIVGLEEGHVFVGRAGGVVQMCFEDPCNSSFSYSATLMLAGPAMVGASGAGFIWRVSRVTSLLLEADMLIPLGSEAGEINGLAVAPGIRFSGANWGVDLALMAPVEAEETPLIPFVAATYRFLP